MTSIAGKCSDRGHCTSDRGQDSPIQTDLARLISCLLYGQTRNKKEKNFFLPLRGLEHLAGLLPHCVRSVLATSVKILPYRPPAQLIRTKYCRLSRQQNYRRIAIQQIKGGQYGEFVYRTYLKSMTVRAIHYHHERLSTEGHKVFWVQAATQRRMLNSFVT